MRTVSYEDFLKEPVGTVFSLWTPCYSRDLYVKLDTVNGADFLYVDLLPGPDGDYDHPEISDDCARYGLFQFDKDQVAAIYEEADLAILRRFI